VRCRDDEHLEHACGGADGAVNVEACALKHFLRHARPPPPLAAEPRSSPSSSPTTPTCGSFGRTGKRFFLFLVRGTPNSVWGTRLKIL
jgi:hypothetical protein